MLLEASPEAGDRAASAHSGDHVGEPTAGQQDHAEPAIHLDEKTRQALGLEEGREAEFTVRKVGWPGQFLWAWRAADPAYRIAARLGLLSVLLGLAGFAIAVITMSCW